MRVVAAAVAGAAVLLLLAAAGCASRPAAPATAAAAAEAVPAAGEAATGETPAEAGTEPAAEPGAEAAEATERPEPDDPTVVTIEPAGGRAPEPRTLAEAAQAARERRRESRRATTVITNENLSEFAAGGQVTIVTPAPGAAAEPEPGAAGTPAAPGDPAAAGAAGHAGAETPEPAGPRDETYWRGRVRDLRARWAAAAAEIGTLEKEAADLRWAFYAEDDPYYRDERIKPEWDRVLDELRRARQDARAFERDLGEALEDGRRAGALPGWLRDGVELEPEPLEDEGPVGREPRTAEPIEPPQAGESGRP